MLVQCFLCLDSDLSSWLSLFTLFITTKILLLSFKIKSWSVPLSEVLCVFSLHINYPVSSFRPTLLHCECLLYYLKFLLQISTWVHGWLLIDYPDILFLWNSIFILGKTISWSNESACRKERWNLGFVHPCMDYAILIQYNSSVLGKYEYNIKQIFGSHQFMLLKL